jgi:cell wall assembly regulator SMI1
MNDIWRQIEAWLRTNAPDILADLRPGASEKVLEAAAATFGSALPSEMEASYRVHDGTRGSAPPLFGDWRLLSLEAGVREWSTIKGVAEAATFDGMESDSDPQINDGWWRPGWVPVGSNDSGDFLCVDLDPAPGGTLGQIISYLHAEPRRALVAPSFEAWLHQFISDLQTGRITVKDGRLVTST